MRKIEIYDAETMDKAIREFGIIPFFKSKIPGFSIRELTKPGFWFDDGEDTLGPWDWKINCLQNGGIAYGKFLSGGKAAFATVPFYRELMNFRRAANQPDECGQKIMAHLAKRGVITIREIRELLGVKKSAADAAVAKLQHQCRIVTGILERIYRGPNNSYCGWQIATYCTPESLFAGAFSLHTDHTPEESLALLKTHISEQFSGNVSEMQLAKVLR